MEIRWDEDGENATIRVSREEYETLRSGMREASGGNALNLAEQFNSES